MTRRSRLRSSLRPYILFREPLHYLLDTAHEIERQYHVDLVQSLVVLGVVFAFHQYRKRQEAKADFIGAAAEANQARLRSRELERLVGLSRTVAMATDFTGLHQAFSRYLPQFTRERASWLLICHQGCWDVLVRGVDDHRPPALHAARQRGRITTVWTRLVGSSTELRRRRRHHRLA